MRKRYIKIIQGTTPIIHISFGMAEEILSRGEERQILSKSKHTESS
jgi:hypothetical protein